MVARTPVLGMIGCGYWGPNLLRNYCAIESVRVKVVADRDPGRRRFVERTHPTVALVDDGAAIIADPEITAVVIATPAGTHAELARAALVAGKDVFVEK